MIFKMNFYIVYVKKIIFKELFLKCFIQNALKTIVFNDFRTMISKIIQLQIF
jgi:hypothetical protein